MKGIEIKPCCAICELLYDSESCPLCPTYSSARNYGDMTFEEKGKYVVCCNVFELSKKFVCND